MIEDIIFSGNGLDYVNLGLPSGTLWATKNIGASKPSDSGLYFQWGDIQGYTKGQIGKSDGKKKFSLDWSDYKWGNYSNFTKYKTYGSMLELEDDAAHINMNGDWHIPSPVQIKELLDNTTNTWTTQDGVNGRLFTSKSDSSKSIFIPAAGDVLDGSVCCRGSYGNVWSSMMDIGNVNYGQNFYFDSEDIDLYDDYRCNGSSVRGVIDKIQKNG